MSTEAKKESVHLCKLVNNDILYVLWVKCKVHDIKSLTGYSYYICFICY